MRFIGLAVMIALWSAPALAHSKEWQDGWCAGFRAAVTASKQNIDHYKYLIGDTAIGDSPIARTARTMLQGVDLYVGLPELRGTVILAGGEKINCGN